MLDRLRLTAVLPEYHVDRDSIVEQIKSTRGNLASHLGVRRSRVLERSGAVDEQRLIMRLKKRDEAAFKQLVSLHKGRVYNLCFRMLSNTAEAEDIAQDAFVRAFLAIESFRGDSQLSTWLYRIAMNLCKNRIKYHARRHKNAHASLDDLYGGQHQPAPHSSGRTPLGEPAPRPDQAFEGVRAETRVHRALAAVDSEFRELLVLRDINGLTYDEIRQVTGLPEGTVKSRLHRARGALKRAYDAQEDEES